MQQSIILKKQVTKQHLENIQTLLSENLSSKFDNKEIINILDSINEYIKTDQIIKVKNKDIPKSYLYLFNFINEYHTSYKLSNETDIKSRKNTYEALDKRNTNRKKRYEENKKLIEDKNIIWSDRLVAFLENIILKYTFNGNQKTAYLFLALAFILKDTILEHLKNIFRFNKKFVVSLDKLNESLGFYSFINLSPQKIAVSMSIIIFKYLKENTNLEDKKIVEFIRYILNRYFSDHAHVKIEPSFFNREIYCAGIYNSIPIFQWYTSTKYDSYYSSKDIKRVRRIYKASLNGIKDIKYILVGALGNKLNKKDRDTILNPSNETIKDIIDNLPNIYINLKQTNLNKTLGVYKQKTIKYYLLYPISLISTILVGFYTKLFFK